MFSSEKGVKSRCVAMYLGIAALAAAMAALATGASAASKCHPLNTTVYADPTGDGSGANAPDIASITVTSYERGGTSFQIGLDNGTAFTSDMVIRTFIDSDKTSTTGNPKGFEYMIQAQGTATPGGDNGDYDQGAPPGDGSGNPPAGGAPGDQPAGGGSSEWAVHPRALKAIRCNGDDGGDSGDAGIALYKWNGSGWAPVNADSLSGWFADGNLNIEINAQDLGNALAFNFAVYAAANVTFDDAGWPVLTNVSYDWAPDTSTYSYQPFDYSAYNDPTGDGTGPGAPDISKVVVTRWRHEYLNFSIEIPATQEFAQDMLMRVYVDSDNDPTTGDPHGFDYAIQAQRTSYAVGGDRFVTRGLEKANCYQPLLFLFQWQGGAWVPVPDATFGEWRFEKGLRFSIDQADLGGARNFNFAVYAASHVSFGPDGHPNVASAAFDWAPDTATFSFPLAPENGQFLGTYKVSEKIVSSRNFGGMRRGSTSRLTWRFDRNCKKGDCTTSVANGDSRFDLSRAGKALKGRGGRKFDCQAGYSASGRENVQIKAQQSRWIKGQWRVVKWSGTARVVSPSNGVAACGGSASYTASLAGTLSK
jgi:hypothetical protein